MNLPVKKIVFFFSLLLLTFWLSGCATTHRPDAAKEEKIKVAASIFPLADITGNIGGDKIETVTLIPAGSSPHTFEATPEQVKYLSRAQLFVKVGAGLDTFADKLVESANPGLVTVTVTDSVQLLDSLHRHGAEGSTHHHECAHQAKEETGHEHAEHATAGEEHRHAEADNGHLHQESHGTPHQGHHHGDKDPHVWLDPVLVKEHIAPQIAAALAEISPENSSYFKANLEAYCNELELLHQDMAEKTAGFNQHTFIAFHSAWRYLAHRYGLKDITVEEFPGKEPTAQWITQVVETARAENVKAILAEPQFSTKAAGVIAAEFGAPVLIVDPLGAEDKEGYDSYLSMMRSNLTVLEQALQ
ncbi:MAG: metal ABC transporter substrate-binding protein [Firmicutes bacterium]|nr:metal ABC transporter substrate-binding protein [Bacillota bacterium]